jgi:phosphoglycolate phosphatase
MAVVTNKPDRFVDPLLNKTGLDQYFRIWVGGDTLEVKKPDPAPLLYAMEQLGGTRGTTVMVGDSAADVNAAQAAGIPCVAVRYGYNFGGSVNNLGADAVVDSLAQLL